MSHGATLYFYNDNHLGMKHILLTLWLMLLLLTGCGSDNGQTRIIEDFNFDWSFTLGDNSAYSSPDYNDMGWRQLHLPHDWSIEGEFSRKHRTTPAGGALPAGIGWYRKCFVTPDLDDKHLFIELDGVFRNSTLYVNGTKVGQRPNGYVSMSYDITEYLRSEGEQNVISVRVDNSLQPASRWYTGSGIYRDVRLVTTSNVYVEYQGTHVTTPEISKERAMVHAVVSICNDTNEYMDIVLKNIVLNARGKFECLKDMSVSIKAGEKRDVEMDIVLEAPTYWDINNPYLYTLRSIIEVDGKAIDEYDTKFGVRHMEYRADTGFWLNGRNIKLKGVCLHHDLGVLGSAAHRSAIERQLDILQSAGVNAIRTAHNPASPILLDLCDERGILIVAETFDTWQRAKVKHDYARYFSEWWERDLSDIIKRDRNHPSIIMWSVGNEVDEQWYDTTNDPERNKSVQLVRSIVGVVKNLDTTRPVTAACNNLNAGNNLLRAGALDVIGINYNHTKYEEVRAMYPDTPIIVTESADITNRSSWVDAHEEAWLAVRDKEYIAGMFAWSGFDYLGEPTPYAWPSRSSRFGIVDLAGFEKDVYHMYRSEWTSAQMLQLYPHWNWTEGKKIDVRAYYNNADEVELVVNDKSMGRRAKSDECLHAVWEDVEFEPGEITAIAYKDGQEVMRHSQKTSMEPDNLRLSVSDEICRADGYDLTYITIECLDSDNTPVPTATNQLYIDIEGAGELMGVDNGNPAGGESLKGQKIKLYNGKALAVVRTLRNIPGDIRIKVRGDGIKDAEMIITSK